MNTFLARMALLRAGGIALATALLLPGCASLSPAPPVDILPTTPPPLAATPRAAAPVTGSLYSQSSYRPAFEDRRARMVGDTVTIMIVENVTASQKSSSTVDRSSEISAGITALPFVNKSFTDKTALGANSANTFAGKGGTESANTFTGSITATVQDVLPNGHLVITGEKQVGVNRSVDVLRFSGIVDPRHLRRGQPGHPGSVIDSRYVANVRVISRGLGEQAEAQAMGWLARAFNTISPF